MTVLTTTARKRGFTIIEIIVVVGIIAVLAGVLLVALSGARKTSEMTLSMNNLKQIATWMRTYSTENREFIVPSQFDYTGNTVFGGNVRTGELGHTVAGEWEEQQGTWSDILWVHSGLQVPSIDNGGNPIVPYRFDSPDFGYFQYDPDYRSPFWSAAQNTFNSPLGTDTSLPRPFGDGAQDVGKPGHFAANNFFDARPGGIGHIAIGQIKVPDRSVYLVDSVAGEIIEDEPDPWNIIPDGADDLCEIDFRYNETCLMMMLDGSYKTTGESWDKLDDLEDSGTRVRNLNRKE